MGDDELAVTRRSLHGVAELVLAGPQYRATGKLRLGVVPGGFATILTPRLRVDGGLVIAAEGAGVPMGGRTPRALGAELGVAPAVPTAPTTAVPVSISTRRWRWTLTRRT